MWDGSILKQFSSQSLVCGLGDVSVIRQQTCVNTSLLVENVFSILTRCQRMHNMVHRYLHLLAHLPSSKTLKRTREEVYDRGLNGHVECQVQGGYNMWV